MKKLITVIAVTMAAIAFATPDPVVWFRAADAQTNENGLVTSVPNRGSLSDSLPRLVPNKDAHSITLKSADANFGGQPTLSFDANGWLESESATTLGFPTDSAPDGMAWFALYKFKSWKKNNSIFGVVSSSPSSWRFAAFATGGGTAIRCPFIKAAGFDLSYAETARLTSVSAYVTEDSTRIGCGYVNAKCDNQFTGYWDPTSRMKSGKFHLGDCGLNWNQDFLGEIAEFRLFNQPLTAAERLKVEGEMATRYALEFKMDDETVATAAMTEGFTENACAFGYEKDRGKAESAIVTEVTCGDLVLSFVETPSKDVNSLVYAADDGGSAWVIFGSGDARALALDLSFPLTNYSSDDFRGPKLKYRADKNDLWADLDFPSEIVGDRLVFRLPSGWSCGQYMVGSLKPIVWYRADTGVTVGENDAVTGWANGGSLGVVADLVNIKGTVTRVSDAGADVRGALRTALRFPTTGDAWLGTEATGSFGLTSGRGNTSFFVCKPVDAPENRKDMSFFGFNFGDYSRFGAFSPKGSEGKTVRCYAGASKNMSLDLDIPNGWQILEIVGDAESGRLIASVNELDSRRFASGFSTSIHPAQLMVGRVLADTWAGTGFKGDVAELRIYNRELTDTERAVIRAELATRYNIPIGCLRRSALAPDASADIYDHEIAAVGAYAPAMGISGSSSKKGVSGCLTIACSEGDPLCVDRIVTFGHDGGDEVWMTAADGDPFAARLGRIWAFDVNGSYAPDLRFDFAVGDTPSAEGYALAYRKTYNGAWTVVPHAASAVEGGIAVNMESDEVKSGYYTLVRGATLPLRRVSVALSAGVKEGLCAWYRADAGLSISGDAVTGWANSGTFGSAFDLEVKAGQPTFDAAACGGAGGVRLNGSSYLETKTAQDLGISRDATWFAVCAPQKGLTTASRGNMAVWGIGTEASTDASRIGAFWIGTGDALRIYSNCKNDMRWYDQFPDTTTASGDSMILSARIYGWQVCDVWDNNQLSNKVVYYAAGINGNLVNTTLKIGWMLNLTQKFKGDIAEVRLYDRPLCEIERNIVRNHMAARYGIALTTDNYYADGASAGYVEGITGIGRTDSNAPNLVPGWVTESDDSNGLKLTHVGGMADGEYILFGHERRGNRWIKGQGGRMSRAWYIEKNKSKAASVRFSFDIARAGLKPLDPQLDPSYFLAKMNEQQEFVPVEGVTVEPTDTGFSCVLPAAQFDEGVYTLGVNCAKQGLIIVVE